MKNETSYIDTSQIGAFVLQERLLYESMRKRFERRWYDNYFFDDGYHFRFISKTTGKIVDLSQGYLGIPARSIPKASRQIRGIANLLTQPEYQPVIFPESLPPNLNEQERMRLDLESKQSAKYQGWWMETEWKNQELKQKMIDMLLKAAKCGISYIQVWPDAVKEEIRTAVYDAFDIFHRADINELHESPSIIKGIEMLIDEIRANETYDEQARLQITPDNKYAASKIKDSYLRYKFTMRQGDEKNNSAILDEAYIQEYLDDNNWEKATKDLEDTDYLDGKSKGDLVIRQVCEAQSVALYDKYVPLPRYPFIDFRYEPGPVYQTPLIERFIPANKSLDVVMSRVEHWIGTQAVGLWAKRKGDNFQLSNLPGGQVVEYEGVAPQNIPIPGMPNTVWNYINTLMGVIDEQGVSAATGELPPGVKSGVAIEAVKSAEYANLKIPADMLKLTITRLSEVMLDIADHKYAQPRNIDYKDNGELINFQVIGKSNLKRLNEVNEKAYVDAPVNAVPISKNLKVDIEVQSGLGFTYEGKITRMQQIADYMRSLAAEGYITQDQVQQFLQKFLEVFQYGATAQFFEDGGNGATPFTAKQLEMIKIAVLESLSDMQKASMPTATEQGTPQPVENEAQATEEEDITKVKIGVMEALNDIKNGEVNAQNV